jgi:diguanylate cyclase (GGDEF)-like protein/PAS domain S-box-containing protein
VGAALVELFVRLGVSPFGPVGWPGVGMLAAAALWGAWSLAGGAAVSFTYYFLNAAYAERFPDFFAGLSTRLSWLGGFAVLGAAALVIHGRLRRAESAASLAAQLRLSEARLRVITDNTPALVSYIDAEERYRFNNRAYEDWLGLPRERLTGRTVREVWGEERYALMRPNIARALRGERVSLEYSMPEGGVERRILSTYVPDADAAGAVKGFFVLGSDVTPLAAARAELSAARERLEKALDGSSVALWDADLRSGRVYLSEAWSQIIGEPRAESVVHIDELFARVHPADLESARRASLEAMKGLRPAYAAEHRVRAADGGWRWILSRGRVTERDPASGRALRMIGTNLDITDRKRMEEALHSVAHSDPLTGLANRTLLMDRLRHAAARSRRNGTRLALLYLDIDGFKAVNDRHGHLAGDALLRGFAQRLRTCVRATDTVARLGGDEFVVLLDELQDAENASRVAEKILETVRAPIAAEEQDLAVTTSIGIAHDDSEGDEERLLRRADAALYAAKAAGRNGYRIA